MEFWIKKIILWPSNVVYGPREIDFENNKVNVIHGESQTGKSAIISIVDYCLASSECRIPVDIIRNCVSWYGVLFSENGEDLLICRKGGRGNNISNDFYFRRGIKLTVPRQIEASNVSMDFVKETLNEIFDFSCEDMAEFQSFGVKGRPSFRDIAAFLYQPQNIIANPDSLFYKLDKLEHRNKLAAIFPYLLGVVSGEDLLNRQRLKELESILKRKQLELKSVKKVSRNWLEQIHNDLSQAAEFGLCSNFPREDLDFEGSFKMVEDIVTNASVTIKLSSEAINASSKDLVKLKDKEFNNSIQIEELKTRRETIIQILDAHSDYKRSLNDIAERLNVFSWMKKKINEKNVCPLCGGSLSKKRELYEILDETAIDVSAKINERSFRNELLAEKSQLEKQLQKLIEDQNAVSLRLKKLENERKGDKYQLAQIQRFLGYLDASYKQYKALMNSGEKSDLQNEIDDLTNEINQLQALTSKKDSEMRLKETLNIISDFIFYNLQNLDVEHRDWRVEFDYKDISLRIVDNYGKSRFLNEIGSASNWLSYHIALILAIQEYVQKQKEVHMPSFLICDQPSQVYFPNSETKIKEDYFSSVMVSDADRMAVKNIFKLFDDFVDRLDFSFQIIVTEHAGDDIWGEFNNVVDIAYWSENTEKLVPFEWVEASDNELLD